MLVTNLFRPCQERGQGLYAKIIGEKSQLTMRFLLENCTSLSTSLIDHKLETVNEHTH